jgi:hypothetical protein
MLLCSMYLVYFFIFLGCFVILLGLKKSLIFIIIGVLFPTYFIFIQNIWLMLQLKQSNLLLRLSIF